MFRRLAISLLLSPSPIRPITSCSRRVMRTSSSVRASSGLYADRAIWEISDSAICGGSTFLPAATARMVATNSSKLASLRTKPATPALTNSLISSCTGKRSMTMIFASGCSPLSVAATPRLSSSRRPTSRSNTPRLFPRGEEKEGAVGGRGREGIEHPGERLSKYAIVVDDDNGDALGGGHGLGGQVSWSWSQVPHIECNTSGWA